MTRRPLHIALALSLLVNLGVLAAVAYRGIVAGDLSHGAGSRPETASLPRYLQLSAEQTRDWQATESTFLAQLRSGASDIRAHRDRLIREIFSTAPDPAKIDAERENIGRLQDEQQKLVIRQLLRERELLLPAQRESLARLLLEQPVLPSSIEQLHRD